MVDYKTLENQIRTRLQGKIPNSVTTTLDKKKITYSTEIVQSAPSFPNVYIHQMEGMESDSVLEGDRVFNMLYTIQVEVTSNRSKVDARDIAYAIMDEMKKMCFNATSVPIYTKNDTIHGFVARYRRYISPDDNI